MTAETGQSFVVLKDFGENKCVLLGRNSLQGEAAPSRCPEVVFFPTDDRSAVKCSNVEVEGGAPLAVILNRTIKNWGSDSGANEKGVTISVSSATNEKNGLLSTELARLGLERSLSAAEAVDVVTALNEKFGSDYDGPDSTKISLLICDPTEVWILDIVGKFWAAEQITEGYRKVPPCLNVGTKFDRSSENLQERVQDLALWNGSGELNFREAFGSSGDFQWPTGDLAVDTSVTLEDMFNLLRADCPSGVKSSQVSVLSGDNQSCHWFTATNNTKESVFKPFVFTANVRISPLTVYDQTKDPETTLLVKYHSGRDWTKAGDLLKSLEQTCVAEVKEALAHCPNPSELEELMKDCVEAEVKFYR